MPVKVAVVTGAAQGIGQQTAELLAEQGYEIVAFDLQSCGDILGRVKARGRAVLEMTGDVSDERACN